MLDTGVSSPVLDGSHDGYTGGGPRVAGLVEWLGGSLGRGPRGACGWRDTSLTTLSSTPHENQKLSPTMQSDGSDSVSQSPTTQRLQSLSASDTRGKHRILAELKRFEQEARFLEEELEQLEKIDKASAACKE
ncbi:hypothetical protein J5N97_000457 [Dioscorea zingiberensis]|uniref:Uncharacterized protein n=1 Tax=Dioscorea zingiberensis TaxID=325984 RepID=A0A9D5BS77_9LILI|nr:hypothetical protein J5N97_000457 [Dioscorea zingiberensis]